MLNIIKRVLSISGNQVNRIKAAFLFSFLESIFASMPMAAIFYVLFKIIDDTGYGPIKEEDIWISAGLIFLGLLGQYTFKLLICHFQNASGYHMFSEERIKLGNHLKRLPMGFFTDGNIGDISAIVTSDFTFIEMYAMHHLDKMIHAITGIITGTLLLTIFDWRIALIAISVTIPVSVILNKLQTIGHVFSAKRQATQANMVTAVLEYMQGMSVIKAFNMTGEKAKKTKDAFRETRNKYMTFEKKFIWPNTLMDMFFAMGIGLVIFMAISFYNQGSLSKTILLVMLIFTFKMYLPLQALGLLTGFMRILDACLDRFDKVYHTREIDSSGQDSVLPHYHITFQDVSFAYEDKEVLHHLSFDIPVKSMTALIGPSGCGKTTIVNLIARFYDVQKGQITIGGVNVKELTCDSLLKNISMVFQKVYLFHDTILNNVKMGRQDATMEEVIEACKKARCHAFITAMKKGYETIVGEGGFTLSGGEKQRLSIARAILKDAPIVLLDEATASMDPDNEKYIQLAINALVKNKTLVVIAHRLSTIQHADQIIVLNEGKIVEKGTHQVLIDNKGLYFDYWQRRSKARSWTINKA